MRLRWTRPAVADVVALTSYVATDNPSAARRVQSRIIDHHIQVLWGLHGAQQWPDIMEDTGL